MRPRGMYCMMLLTIGMLRAQLMLPAYAASFNCSCASTCTEEVLCQTPQLSDMDSEMANLFF